MARRTSSELGFGYSSLLPAIILVSALSMAPMIYAIAISLLKYKITLPGKHPFIFLKNYVDVIGSIYFRAAIQNTLVFTLAAVISVFALALIFSLVLNERFRGNIWIKVLILVPWAIPEVANALVWKWIFDSHWGIFNAIMVYVLNFLKTYQSWMGDPRYAMVAILVPHIWNEVPLATILFLAGYSMVPTSLYEAAKLDGANALLRFKRITYPLLKPVIQLILVYETIMGITSFAYVYILTGGGPGLATTTLSWYVYWSAFTFGDYGQGAALAVIMGAISLLLILLYFRLVPTREFGTVTV